MKQYQLDRNKGANMREGLEIRRGRKPTVGSNPIFSANFSLVQPGRMGDGTYLRLGDNLAPNVCA